MDMKKRNKLIAKIMRQYDDDVSPPVVALDEFFDGNSDEYSLAPNHVGDNYPAIERMWTILRDIRDRSEVDDVLVGIHECPEADDDADIDMWAQAENVYIYTSAAESDVAVWVRDLKCNGIIEGWPYGVSSAAPTPRDGSKVYALCWD